MFNVRYYRNPTSRKPSRIHPVERTPGARRHRARTTTLSPRLPPLAREQPALTRAIRRARPSPASTTLASVPAAPNREQRNRPFRLLLLRRHRIGPHLHRHRQRKKIHVRTTDATREFGSGSIGRGFYGERIGTATGVALGDRKPLWEKDDLSACFRFDNEVMRFCRFG